MANSSVDLATPTGVADTRTDPDGNHRQVVVLGDPDAASVATVSTGGELLVSTVRAATYFIARGPASGSAPVAPSAPAAVANIDKILVQGWHLASSTKTVKIRRIWVSALLGTAVTYLYSVYRTSSTVPTGGTAVASTKVDSADPASECVWQYQNTVAIATALVNESIVDMAQPSTVGGHSNIVLYDFGEMGKSKPLTMRAGVAEGFAITSRTTTATAPDAIISIEYTEE